MSKYITNIELEEICYQAKKIGAIHTALMQTIYSYRLNKQNDTTANIDTLYYAFVAVDDMLDSLINNLDTYI